jgi:excisionase family DNA binding protein
MNDIELIPLMEVRERLKISKATLWRWIKDGKLSTVKLSERKIYVKRNELERFIRESSGK